MSTQVVLRKYCRSRVVSGYFISSRWAKKATGSLPGQRHSQVAVGTWKVRKAVPLRVIS